MNHALPCLRILAFAHTQTKGGRGIYDFGHFTSYKGKIGEVKELIKAGLEDRVRYTV